MPANTATETFKISCTACSARLTVKKADEGKKIKCPKCRSVIVCDATVQPEASPLNQVQAETAPSTLAKSEIKSTAKLSPAPASAEISIDSGDWGTATPKTTPASAKSTPRRH